MSAFQNNIFDEEDSAADLAVVGLGPGGLAAALQAAKRGKKVVALTDRTDYIRGQRLKLSRDTVIFLMANSDKADPEDRLFWQKFKLEGDAQLKDIERFLYRKLLKEPNVQIVQLDKQTPKSIQSVGKGEEDSANFIQLQDGTKYYCRNILAADGAKHSFADMINTHLEAGISYRTSPLQERHHHHAVVQLQLKAGEIPGSPVKLDIVEKMRSLGEQGWDKSYQPKHYIFPNASKTKFYFAGEVPKEVFEEKDDGTRADKLKKWASKAIYEKYGITEDQLEFRKSEKTPAKNRLQATAFEMQIVICKKPVVDLSNGVFSQIGDARRTPNYHLAHGMNDSIRGGITFANAITASGFRKPEFIRSMDIMDKQVEGRMMREQLVGSADKMQNRQMLVESLDRLVTRLERDPKNAGAVSDIKQAKNDLETKDDLSTVYDVINKVQPIAEIHKDTGFLYRVFRAILSLFDAKATLTKSAIILDEVKKNVETYSERVTL